MVLPFPLFGHSYQIVLEFLNSISTFSRSIEYFIKFSILLDLSKLSNFLRLLTKSILLRTKAFIKFGYSLCFYSLIIDYFIMLSNLFALSTTSKVKSIYERTFQPLDKNPYFLYMSPGVSKYFNWTFLNPYSVSFSKDFIPCIIYVVVAAFGETALIGWDNAPNNCDFPAFTGPIIPIFKL